MDHLPNTRALAGEVRGLRMLHVLCNSGQDTLSWAKLGAAVTGVDLSDEAIAFATTLSADTGIGATGGALSRHRGCVPRR